MSNPQTTWLPIETAPKDGSTILACVKKFEATTCRWVHDPIADKGQWHTEYVDIYEDDDELHNALSASKYEPTHWMRLPEPPNV